MIPKTTQVKVGVTHPVRLAMGGKPCGMKSKCRHHQTKDHDDTCREVAQFLRNSIEPRPRCAGLPGRPRRGHANVNEPAKGFRRHVRFWPMADIVPAHVRFDPRADSDALSVRHFTMRRWRLAVYSDQSSPYGHGRSVWASGVLPGLMSQDMCHMF